jgi:hypothetical protein
MAYKRAMSLRRNLAGLLLVFSATCAMVAQSTLNWDWHKQEALGRTDPSLGNTSKLTEAERKALIDDIVDRLRKPMTEAGYDDDRIREIASTTRLRFVDVGAATPYLFTSSLGMEGGCDALSNCPLWIFRRSSKGFVPVLQTDGASYTIQPEEGAPDVIIMHHDSAGKSGLHVYRLVGGKLKESGCYTAHWPKLSDDPAQLLDPEIVPCTEEGKAAESERNAKAPDAKPAEPESKPEAQPLPEAPQPQAGEGPAPASQPEAKPSESESRENPETPPAPPAGEAQPAPEQPQLSPQDAQPKEESAPSKADTPQPEAPAASPEAQPAPDTAQPETSPPPEQPANPAGSGADQKAPEAKPETPEAKPAEPAAPDSNQQPAAPDAQSAPGEQAPPPGAQPAPEPVQPPPNQEPSPANPSEPQPPKEAEAQPKQDSEAPPKPEPDPAEGPAAPEQPAPATQPGQGAQPAEPAPGQTPPDTQPQPPAAPGDQPPPPPPSSDAKQSSSGTRGTQPVPNGPSWWGEGLFVELGPLAAPRESCRILAAIGGSAMRMRVKSLHRMAPLALS